MKILKHAPNDWCHICGNRGNDTVDVWYPENAEHDKEDTKYIRICVNCAEKILAAWRKEDAVSAIPADNPPSGRWRVNFFDTQSDELRSLTVEAETEGKAEEEGSSEADRRGWPESFRIESAMELDEEDEGI